MLTACNDTSGSGTAAPSVPSTSLGTAAPLSSATSIASVTTSAPPSTASSAGSSAEEISSSANSSSEISTPGRTVATDAELQVADAVTGLDTPWGIAFLPDGAALVTSRDTGTVQRVAADSTVTALGTVDGVTPGGEAGLLGVAVSPDFTDDRTVFVYYTAETDNRIATLTLDGDALTDQQVILEGIPKAGNHDGGRMIFGPDGLLYVGTGDAGERPNSQDLGSLGGKILRLDPDGSGAEGNPFPDAPLVYSLGHRNVQGLAFDDRDRLWAAEFGQNTYDELNLISSGGNYGWPEVEGPSEGVSDYVAPQQVWSTSDASPSGIAYWDGSIWMAGLGGERLWQIPLTGATDDQPQTTDPVARFDGEYGRLRTVLAAPDGSLWLSTSNTDGRGDPADGDDRILRLTA